MTQLSATPTVSKLALHRETVMNLGGTKSAERAEPAVSTRITVCNACSVSCGICTVYSCKHCTKKPGGCLA